MSYLLSAPTAVFVVGDDDTVARFRAALVPSVATELVGAADGATAETVLTDRNGLGCVIIDETADPSPAATAEPIRESAKSVPILVTASPADCDRAALATLSDCRLLGPADDETLATVVGEALATFDERRRRDAESSLFRTLLSDGELAIFAKDREGRHVYKADVQDDVDPEAVIGKTDFEVAPDYLHDQTEQDGADDMQVIETGEPIYDRVREYNHDGYDHWAETTKVPWTEDGEVIGLVGYALDASDRKRHEQHLSEQSERIDQFINYVAHDLRTPLQIVYGEIDLARSGAEDAIDGIERGVERIESIVEDLSALTKQGESPGLSSGALQSLRADSITTELPPLVENVWTLIAPDEATFQVDVPAGTVVAVEAETLRPLVENLLKNAVDHAGPDVTVTIGALDRGFFVADDGPGIPEAERSEVIRSGYTTAEDGTGTGLAIVADTVEQQGWDLSITEATEGGSGDASGNTAVDQHADGRGACFEIRGVPMVTRPDLDVRPGTALELDANEDVGPVSIDGNAEYDLAADEWTVVANGSNVWGNTHEFHYVHGEAEAPVRIEADITSLDGPDEFTKAGVTVRASVDKRAPFGYVGVTRSHGSEVTWRESADGFTDSDQFEELPGTFQRYRVDYVDGWCTLSVSESGETWLPVDQQRIDLGEAVSVGLMVCSHSSHQTCEAVFRDVTVHELERE